MKDPMGGGWPQSVRRCRDEAELPQLIAQMRLHCGLAAGAIAAAVAAVGPDQRARCSGFDIRAVGENARAARYAGMPVTRTMVAVGAALRRAAPGSPARVEVAGLQGLPAPPTCRRGFGYAGIVVAMLAGSRRWA